MVMDHYPYKKQTLMQNPGAFSDVYDSPLGARFWKFLTQPENVLLLEGATFLRQPAIVVLAPRLLAEFDRELRDGDAGKGADRLSRPSGPWCATSWSRSATRSSVPASTFSASDRRL